MQQTQMTAAQITIWFTNARVRLRKESKRLQTNEKKSKKKVADDTDDIIILPNPSPPSRRFIFAYSNLYKDQIVCLQISPHLF